MLKVNLAHQASTQRLLLYLLLSVVLAGALDLSGLPYITAVAAYTLVVISIETIIVYLVYNRFHNH